MGNIEYESHGRRLLVEFKCQRCGAVALRSYEACLEEAKECYRGLYDCRPPTAWEDGGFYYPLFCEQCKEDYAAFMKGAEVIR